MWEELTGRRTQRSGERSGVKPLTFHGLALAAVLVLAPGIALAYIGPGVGLGAIASSASLVGAVLLGVVGFIWYPLKRLLKIFQRTRPVTSDVAADAGAVFLVVAFVWLFFLFRAPLLVKRVLIVSQGAAAALRNPSATDDEKERAAQRSSAELFGLFFLMVFTFAGALLAPVAVLWLLDVAKLVPLHAVISVTMSLSFLVTCTVAGCAVGFVWPRVRRRLTSHRR